MWDQLKTGSVATATAASPVAPQPVVIPHMLMMPQVNLVMNQMGAAEETRSSEETALKKHEDELQRKRERERERRERKRQEREAAKASLAMEIEGSNDTALPLESRAILAHFSRAAMIEDEDDDLRYEAQARRKKRFRRDESEREEVVEEEEELEYGEGSNVAPKLGTMQGTLPHLFGISAHLTVCEWCSYDYSNYPQSWRQKLLQDYFRLPVRGTPR